MDYDQFYVTLPSNASMSQYKDNTKNNFTTELIKPLKFDYPYEVAIVEITTPNIISDIKKSLGKIEIISEVFVQRQTKEKIEIEILFEDLKEKSLEEFLKIINAKLDIAGKEFKMEVVPSFNEFILWSDKRKQFRLHLNRFENDHFLNFYGPIANILGFNPKKNELYQRSPSGSYSDFNCDYDSFGVFDIDTDTIFVYSDIIKHQYVGDSIKQLLRTVHVEKNKESQCINYPSPHYTPVVSNTINSIQLTLKDVENNSIKFKSGTELVIVKLHFRPQKHGF